MSSDFTGEVVVKESRRFSSLGFIRKAFSCFSGPFIMDAVVHPCEQLSITARADSPETFITTPSYENLIQLLKLDPFDMVEVAHQYEIASTRNPDKMRFEMSNFCPYILENIYEYLELNERLKMRGVSRSFLVHHLCFSRTVLYSKLGIRIISGFNLIHKSTLSAILFNQLERPLKDLLSPHTRKIKACIPCPKIDGSPSDNLTNEINEIAVSLDQTTRFDEFLMLSLHFYRRTDTMAYYELVEVILKAEIFDKEAFINNLQVNLFDAFKFSCRKNLLCLGKSIIKLENELDNGLTCFSGAFICIISNNLVLFESILKFLSTIDTLENERLSYLFERTISMGNLTYIRLVIMYLPQLADVPSLCIFKAILSKQTEILEEIVKFRGVKDFDKISNEGLTPIEMASKLNFFEGIEIICKYHRMNSSTAKLPNFFRESSSLKLAIIFKSTEAFRTIINEIVSYRPLDLVYSGDAIAKLILIAITAKDQEALKLLLEGISKKPIRSLQIAHESNDPIRHAINCNYMAGFDLLVEHFGVIILEFIDSRGRDSFLFAIRSGKFDFAFKIAELNRNVIAARDLSGNNALHTALKNSNSQSIESILRLTRLKVSWYTPNYDDMTPIDILLSKTHLFSLSQLQEIFKTIK